ncbi:MAG: S8 family peptidase [Planctomycetota bacterium]|jgi:subtilisin family serine protease
MQLLRKTSKKTRPDFPFRQICKLTRPLLFLLAACLLALPAHKLHGFVESIAPDLPVSPRPSVASKAENLEDSTPIDMDIIPLGGADRCESATVIGSLPFYDTGNTCGYVDDYFALYCDLFGGLGSPDCAYSLTPTSDITVDISLCGSSYDTMIHVYEGACSGIEMVCNNDYCGLQSQLYDVPLTAGNTYYFVVDGTDFSCGNYIIEITTEEIVCSLDCPVDANDEQEACGDDTNGGCNMDIPVFEPINCGDTVCGTAWDANDSRDTDWYEVVTTEETQLTWTVEAEFDVTIGLVESNSLGSGDCNDITGRVEPNTVGGKCEQVSVTTTCLPAGTYWLFVAYEDFFDFPCDSNSDYVATLTCEGCVIPKPDIRVEPNHLSFDCITSGSGSAGSSTPGQAAATSAIPESQLVTEKLINAEGIFQSFEDGLDMVSVIVTLADSEETVAMTDWTSKSSINVMRSEISQRQQRVLSSLSIDEFWQSHRYENMAAFAGAVTPDGLTKLMNDPAVGSIEPVRVLEAHIAQGVDLMNASIYRSSYSGASMSIAICDTGVDYSHPMLGGGGFPNSKVIGGYDFGGTIDNQFNPDPDPDPIPVGQAHGTCCAGIAAGDVNMVDDYIGGVAYNAKIYALKISADNSGSAYSSDMVAAWDWCVTHRDDDPNNPIKVISTSFGGSRYYDSSSCDSFTPAMTTAANNAVAAGITVIASAGNDGYCDSMGWPACISSVISVGAVYDADFGTYQPCVSSASCATKYLDIGCPTLYYAIDETAPDMVTSYSNTADFLDVLAPSNRTYTTDIKGPTGYSTGDYFSGFGGTSAASPYTAGAVACLQEAAYVITGGYLSPAQVLSTLTGTGDGLADGKVPSITKPRVNLGNAIDSLVPCPGQVFTISNAGGLTLEVDSIDTPSWVTLSPAPPYSIAPGQDQLICVEFDCNNCNDSVLSERLLIYSNDPKGSPFPDGVYIDLNCPPCNIPGDFEPDCDVDANDLDFFISHWLDTDCNDTAGDESDWCFGTDFNKLGTVDLLDFSVLADHWLECKLEPPDTCW